MKRCPQCNRVETDDALVFCRVDGTELISESAAMSESATRVLDQSRAPEAQPNELLHHDTSENQRTTSTLGKTPSRTFPDAEGKGPGSKSRMSRRKVALIISLIVLIVIIGPIVILGIVGYINYRHAPNTEVAIESIAVLPFVNQNNDPNTEYLSDGIPESIINSLSQLPNLKVMSRNSVFHYKGKEIDAQTVAKELKVQSLLTGRVTQLGDGLSINVELINAQDNRSIGVSSTTASSLMCSLCRKRSRKRFLRS